MPERSVGDAGVRRNRQPKPALNVLADCDVIRLAFGRADPVGARAGDDGRPIARFGKNVQVCERMNVIGERIVFDADLQARKQTIGRGIPPLRAIDLMRDVSHTECPFAVFSCDPPDRSALAGSKRSRGDFGTGRLLLFVFVFESRFMPGEVLARNAWRKDEIGRRRL